MTAVALPDLDLARLRTAVERLDLPAVDVSRFDLQKLDLGQLSHLDLPRIDLSRVELPRIDLPRIAALVGLGRRAPLLRVPSGPVLVGIAALVGGLIVGGILALLLDPRKGAARRQALRSRFASLRARVVR